ncbi:MAG: hypothetical protein SFY66_02100 [Oculatellaceae cyanobacterium bins.114]|nr:hypothetical protein [Oculatellaceae cyanobacterium bins.114]
MSADFAPVAAISIAKHKDLSGSQKGAIKKCGLNDSQSKFIAAKQILDLIIKAED